MTRFEFSDNELNRFEYSIKIKLPNYKEKLEKYYSKPSVGIYLCLCYNI